MKALAISMDLLQQQEQKTQYNKEYTYSGGAKKCIHILRDVIYVLLFEVELNYGSNV
jgi:hypothetical protein